MGRHGYSDEWFGDAEEQWRAIRWQGALNSALRGTRGQERLAGLLHALDAMPVKRLIAGELVTREGDVCALGCLGVAAGKNLRGVDTEDADTLGKVFDIAPTLAREIMYQNDDDLDGPSDETPEQRWGRVRAWVARQLEPTP